MSEHHIKPFFYLGFRVAIVCAGICFVLFFLIFLVHLPWEQALKLSFFAAVVVHAITYFIIRGLLKNRFEKIQHELQNLSEKHFEDSADEIIRRKDELDDIIIDLFNTSNTIEIELQRLKKLENYRKDFIGDISHELKTPIFAIQGFIETLLDGALEDTRVNKDFLHKAMRNVNRLIVLTQNLMEITKLETGELRPELQVFPLREVFHEILDSVQLKADSEKINIHFQEFDRDLHVVADRNQLRQVITNLLENGIKYNKPDGSVTVGIRPFTKNISKFLIFVSDTGIGIEPKHISRVTQRFFRVDKSRAREKGGTGLGLSIVKHIIESHGEQLFIDSQPGEGTVFSFTIQNADRVSA